MEPITHTLSTGATLVIYRTATAGDLFVGGSVLLLYTSLFFTGLFNLARRRRKL